MPKEKDRHKGTRENIWFPWNEHEALLKGVAALNSSKSEFIRTAVRNLVEEIELKKGAKKCR